MDHIPIQDQQNSTARVGRNFLWMTWSGIISIASSLLVWVFMARMRDIEDVGRFAIVMGLYALFLNITILGLMPYLVNEISRRSSLITGHERSVKEFIGSSALFLSISGILCAIAMTASGFIISDSYQVRMSALVLGLTLVPSNLIAIAEATAISYGRMRLIAAVATIENLLKIIVPLALIFTGFDIVAISVSFAATRFVSMVVYFAVSIVPVWHYAFQFSEFRKLASVCPTFAGTSVMASLNWQAPLFMLAYLSTEGQTAEFGAASRFLIPVSILLAGYVNTVQPNVARLVLNEPEKGGRYLSKITTYPLIVAVVAAFGSVFLSEYVLHLLFGEKYVTAAPTLNLLAMSVIPFCIVMVASRGLIATGLQRIDLYANVAGFIVCVCAGIAAIPRYGALGAAAALLACFSAMALIEIAVLSKRMGVIKIWRRAALSSAGVVLISLLIWNF